MSRIIRRTESDPNYRGIMRAEDWELEANAADAISAAARQVAHTVGASAIVTYTMSGATALRAARERPDVPILGLTPAMRPARRLSLVWGVYSVHTGDRSARRWEGKKVGRTGRSR